MEFGFYLKLNRRVIKWYWETQGNFDEISLKKAGKSGNIKFRMTIVRSEIRMKHYKNIFPIEKDGENFVVLFTLFKGYPKNNFI